MRQWWWVPICLFLSSGHAWADSRLNDVDKIRKYLGLSPNYDLVTKVENIKVAVLDNGFAGFTAHPGSLPDSAQLVDEYPASLIEKWGLGDPKTHIPLEGSDHGRRMAEIIWGMTGNAAHGPHFYLLNANGITNFRRAVRYAIDQQVDIILYSQNWECCGNFNGTGFIDDIVNDATAAGILWINAGGNYRGMVYNGHVPGLPFEHPAPADLRFTSDLDENPVGVTLSWNSGNRSETEGTNKDLDLQVLDPSGKVIGESHLKQVLHKDRLEKGETFLAREKVRVEVGNSRGKYYRIRILIKGGNFNENDRIRVVLIPERGGQVDPQTHRYHNSIQFVDATAGQEIMVPADNPNVITVGDLGGESAKGPTLDGRVKPDVLLSFSDASFSDGLGSDGTSNAAAYFAGVVTALKAYEPALNREALMRYISQLPDPKSLQTDEREVSLEFARHYYGAIVGALEQLMNGEKARAYYKKNGQIVLEVPTFTRALLPLFPQLPRDFSPEKLDQYEFYLVTRHLAQPPGRDPLSAIRVFGFARATGSLPQPAAPYPWEIYSEDPRVFVQLRVGGNTSLPEDVGPGKIWRTPTPEQLRRVLP